MITNVYVCKDGAPVAAVPNEKFPTGNFWKNSWYDEGTPYGLRGVMRAMGLPDHIDMIKRNSRTLVNVDEGIVDYLPNWDALAEDIEHVIKMLTQMTAETGNLLPVEIAEKPGVVYAEYTVKDGADALAMYAKKYEEHDLPVMDMDGHFHFHLCSRLKVGAIIRGVKANAHGVLVPCAYVLYEGNPAQCLTALKIILHDVRLIARLDEPGMYTLRIKKQSSND